jgi:hypothetical protein
MGQYGKDRTVTVLWSYRLDSSLLPTYLPYLSVYYYLSLACSDYRHRTVVVV